MQCDRSLRWTCSHNAVFVPSGCVTSVISPVHAPVPLRAFSAPDLELTAPESFMLGLCYDVVAHLSPKANTGSLREAEQLPLAAASLRT